MRQVRAQIPDNGVWVVAEPVSGLHAAAGAALVTVDSDRSTQRGRFVIIR